MYAELKSVSPCNVLSYLDRGDVPQQQAKNLGNDKASNIFFKLVAPVVVGGTLGAALSFLVGRTIFIFGGIAGGAIGGIAALIFQAYRENQRRDKQKLANEQIVAQLLPQINDQKLKETVQKVHLVVQEINTFSQPTEYYSLQHRITEVTDEMKKKPEIQQIWKAYLEGVQGTRFKYADGTLVDMDVSEQLKRLEGNQTTYTCEWIQPSSPNFSKDVWQISEIGRECFGKRNAWSYFSLMNELKRSSSGCLVARDTQRNVLGFVWFRGEESVLHICGVGRKANTAKLGIGESLFKKLLDSNLSAYGRAVLEVRENNHAAQTLYRKFGFYTRQTVKNYYRDPTENALVMDLDLNQINQRVV